MTDELKLCKDCKHYKDYEDALDWINSRIFGFPIWQMCYHPDRWKSVDYVNGTVRPYGLCSKDAIREIDQRLALDYVITGDNVDSIQEYNIMQGAV